MVSKLCTHSRFSLSVRMNRSAQPLPSGAPDEGGRTFDAEKGDLVLEVVRHVLRSMVMPHGKAAGDRLAEPTEALPHALADRLQRLKAGSLPVRVDPDTFCGAMIDRDEHRRLALASDRRRQIG